jgi:hypothetical protein
MRRWMTLAVVLGVLGGIASPVFADMDMDGSRPKVPARGTEGPDISAKAGSGYLLLIAPSTYPPVVQGVEGPEER